MTCDKTFEHLEFWEEQDDIDTLPGLPEWYLDTNFTQVLGDDLKQDWEDHFNIDKLSYKGFVVW